MNSNRRTRAVESLLLWWMLTMLAVLLSGVAWGLWGWLAAPLLPVVIVLIYLTYDDYRYVSELVREPWQAPVVMDTPGEERQSVGRVNRCVNCGEIIHFGTAGSSQDYGWYHGAGTADGHLAELPFVPPPAREPR